MDRDMRKEDMNKCIYCGTDFLENEPVKVVNPTGKAFCLVHEKCFCTYISEKETNRSERKKPLAASKLEESDKLWRYMDLAKFVSMLIDSSLYFSAPEAFDDIYEGANGASKNRDTWERFFLSYSRAAIITAPDNCWHKKTEEELEETAHRLTKEIADSGKKYVFINCWYHNEYESEAMWNMYSTNVKNAIAIQTTYGALSKQLDQKAEIRPVKYIDYMTQFAGANDRYWCKRKSFEYEKEVRAIVYDYSKTGESGIHIPVDLSQLIKKVYISPYAPKWFEDIIRDLILRYGYDFEVSASEMTEPPF